MAVVTRRLGAVGVALAIRTGVSSARAGTLPTHRHAVATRAHATHLATRRRVVVCVVMGCLSVRVLDRRRRRGVRRVASVCGAGL